MSSLGFVQCWDFCCYCCFRKCFFATVDHISIVVDSGFCERIFLAIILSLFYYYYSPPVPGTACPWHRLSLAPPVPGTACPWHRLSLAPPVPGTACPRHRMSPATPVPAPPVPALHVPSIARPLRCLTQHCLSKHCLSKHRLSKHRMSPELPVSSDMLAIIWFHAVCRWNAIMLTRSCHFAPFTL